jgi:dTDP-4-dehydrorhamnose reductase
MKNILVTGSSGFVGYYIGRVFKNYNLIGIDLDDKGSKQYNYFYNGTILDFKMLKKVFLEHKIDIVIHAAAIKDLKVCEKKMKESEKVNVIATKQLLKLTKENKAKFIFISSDQVFDGLDGNYDETSILNPINFYGITKKKCEEFLSNYKNVAICRTAFVFGKIPDNQGDILEKIGDSDTLVIQGYIVEHIIKRLNDNRRIYLPENEYMNPTSGELLARQLISIIEKEVCGIFHCCGSERISRYNFGLKIAKFYNLNQSLISPVLGNDELRPKDVSMKYAITKSKIGDMFNTIEEMLSEIDIKNES